MFHDIYPEGVGLIGLSATTARDGDPGLSRCKASVVATGLSLEEELPGLGDRDRDLAQLVVGALVLARIEGLLHGGLGHLGDLSEGPELRCALVQALDPLGIALPPRVVEQLLYGLDRCSLLPKGALDVLDLFLGGGGGGALQLAGYTGFLSEGRGAQP